MAIKILIGGSPCTYWSIAQKNNRETEASGMGWELFKNYLIAREKFKPDYFLYENNKSAAQPIKDQISRELGVDLMYINSSLVSAQNRQRFYAFNWTVEQPEDRGILLKDILETGEDLTGNDKSFCLTSSYGGAVPWNTIERNQRNMVAERIPEYSCEKSRPLTASYANKSSTEGSLPSNCFPDNPNKQVWDMIAEPVRVGDLPNAKGEISGSQATRIYSVDGKSVNLVANGGGQGAKTGLYAVPTESAMFTPPHGWNKGIMSYEKSPTLTTRTATQQTSVVIQDAKVGKKIIKGEKPLALINKVYEVKNNIITINGKEYPIKLADGFYIIRKLTPIECERLQTLPDNYTKAVSNAQRYKGLGNGWTAEVIIHILNGILKDVPKDEEIIVLSLYDGIGTGRYCFDKMGFTNVKYHAYEIDPYPIKVAMDNYSDIIQHGDAFAVRDDDWKPPQTRSEWLDELLEVEE
ncbi:MAG: DNA cytosine methyltransferase [Clostridia bacterium]|nr:DNA cytosine methyltransferase [Clostridia bacterium]